VLVHQSLHAKQVQPLLTEALARWQAADGATWLDDDAAGRGWFADRTPRSDSEFSRRGNQGKQNRMDLLTGLTHQAGRLLGYEDEPGGVMQETLDAGTGPTTGPSTATDGLGAAPTLIAWTGDTPWIDGFVSGIGKRR
jgi:hypothetical protein